MSAEAVIVPSPGGEPTVLLAETFESFQGEGPSTGRPCVFVRFSRCNLTCGWCDEKQTWDFHTYHPNEVSRRVPVCELVEQVRASGLDLLVVTGGEPMLQQAAMRALAAGVDPEVRVQVETNGTQIPTTELVKLVDLWVVSPKLAHSGVAVGRRLVPAAIATLRDTGRVVFKFVVTADTMDADFEEIDALAAQFELNPDSIWVMPEGQDRATVSAGVTRLIAPAAARGWQVSTRLHILAGVR